jgi:hypothetical protein
MFSPINLIVDFLFMEILSAPTVDSVKLSEEESIMKSAVRRGAKVDHNVTRAVQRTDLVREDSIPTSRQIHSGAAEAHQVAYTCAKELIDQSRKDSKDKRSLRSTEKYQASLVKHKTLELKKQTILRKLQSGVSPANKGPKLEDDLFMELTVDISEQRKLIKRSQCEAFDDKWG